MVHSDTDIQNDNYDRSKAVVIFAIEFGKFGRAVPKQRGAR